MVSKLDNLLSLQHQALSLRANRQQVLAANIANADTPNYKARDFDFSAALNTAMTGRGAAGLSMSQTSARHLGGNEAAGGPRTLYRNATQGAVDGNTVDMDVERSAFAENAMYYEAGLTFISGKFKTMLTAITSNQ